METLLVILFVVTPMRICTIIPVFKKYIYTYTYIYICIHTYTHIYITRIFTPMDFLNVYNNTRDQWVQLAWALGTSEPWITVCIVFIFTLCMCVCMWEITIQQQKKNIEKILKEIYTWLTFMVMALLGSIQIGKKSYYSMHPYLHIHTYMYLYIYISGCKTVW